MNGDSSPQPIIPALVKFAYSGRWKTGERRILDDRPFQDFENVCYLAERDREAIHSHILDGNADLVAKPSAF
jgi:hypothetical protein